MRCGPGWRSGWGLAWAKAAYLAYGIAQSPAYTQIPWHMFTGFASERLIVTFAHGLMTSLAIAGFHSDRRKACIGYVTSVGLHALINLGPILLALKLVPAAVSGPASYVAILAAFIIFQKQERNAKNASGMVPKEIIYFER